MLNSQQQTEIEKTIQKFLVDELKRIKNGFEKCGKEDFLTRIEEKEKRRSEFVSNYRRIPIGYESFFMVLRRWNSYTPSLPEIECEDNFQNSIGGGYYLYVQGPSTDFKPGYGLVIDPGYNFLQNFGAAGFSLDDIDGILLSHAHNDHTNDFESILSLLYQRNNKFINMKTYKKIDLFMNVGTFKKFSNYLDLSRVNCESYIGNIIIMSPLQKYRIPNRPELDFEILTLKCAHHEIITQEYSLGFCFKMSERNLYLSCDTGWNLTIQEKNEEFLKQNGVYPSSEDETKMIDVMVVHVGSIKRKEFSLELDSENQYEHYYGSHLGIIGIIRLIEKWKPSLCVISEFGEELNDVRDILAKELEKTCKKVAPNIRIIPGDIGLTINIDTKTCICYLLGDNIPWESISYKDIVSKELGTHIIKYFSSEFIEKIQKKDKVIETISFADEVNNIRKNYKVSIINGYDLQKLDGKTDLEQQNYCMEFLESFMYHVEFEWENESEVQLEGCCRLLTCIIDKPLEMLIPLISNGHLRLYLPELLKHYCLLTPLISFYFDKILSLELQADDDPFVNAIYEANKEGIKKMIEHYLSGEIELAKNELDQIGYNYFWISWDRLTFDNKIEIVSSYLFDESCMDKVKVIDSDFYEENIATNQNS